VPEAHQTFIGGLASVDRLGHGLHGITRGIENAGQAGTRLANGTDFLRRAVGDAALEHQRLLEASQLELVRAG
jgi:hypothetical protein